MARMTVTRRKDSRTPRVIMHRIADIRGGVSVKTSELGGDYLREGAVLSVPEDGICHVVKIATVVADVGATEKTVKVAKFHNLRVNDIVCVEEDGAAVKISKIDETNKDYDTVTLVSALGTIAKGGFLVEAAAVSTDTEKSALKFTPLAIVGTGKPIEPKANLDTDAWIFVVTKGNPLPECVAKHLKGVINY